MSEPAPSSPAPAESKPPVNAAAETPAPADPAPLANPAGANPSTVIKLVHIDGTKMGRTDTVDFRPLPNHRLTMGRDPSCVLAFDPYKDPRVSAHHADIFIDGGQIFIEDRGSTNGTRVNGLKIFEKTRLRPGDEVELGRKGSRFRVEFDAKELAADTPPARNGGADAHAKNDAAGTPDAKPADAAAQAKKDPNVLKRGDMRVPASERVPAVDEKFSNKQDGDRIDLGDGHNVGQKTLRLIWRDAADLVKQQGGGQAAVLKEVVKQAARENNSSLYLVLGCISAFFLVIIAALVVMIVILYNQLKETQSEQDKTAQALADANSRITEHDTKIRAVDDKTTNLLTTEEDLAARRKEIEDELRREMARIQAEMTDFAKQHRDVSERFQEVHKQYENSVYLIMCRLKLQDASGKTYNCMSTGTGFLATADGHLITNKHVVQPWKFSETAAQMRHDNLTIVEGSKELYAWPAGSQVLDFGGGLRTTAAKSLTAGTLVEYKAADDRMVPEKFENFGQQMVHATNDNNDIAILQLKGGPFVPCPLFHRSDAAEKGWQPSQGGAVMAVGFPQGINLFETNNANTSLSFGWIRKVEDTIHISAPIIKGNSGGPVFAFNSETGKPEVIAIATRVLSGTENFGMCIKIEHAISLLPRPR